MDKQLKEKTYKQMLYFALVSLTMSFAGLTSAYIISRKREDWVSFDMPREFYISTILIVISSVIFFFAKKSMQKEQKNKTQILFILTIILAGLFLHFQYQGYVALTEMGLYFTGKDSNVASSLFDVIAVAHAFHIIIGMVIILVLMIKTAMNKFSAINMLGIKLGEIFWHFLGALWVFLFLFFLLVL